MAQETKVLAKSTPRSVIHASNIDVDVSDSVDTELLKIQCDSIDRLWVQFTVANQDLATFYIIGRAHPDADEVALYESSADYTSPTGILVVASEDLTAVAAGGDPAYFALDVTGLFEVSFYATGAAPGCQVNIYAGGA